MSKVAVTKVTAAGHQQRYWINPERDSSELRVLPGAPVLAETGTPIILPRTSHTPNSHWRDRGMKWQHLPSGRLKDLMENENLLAYDGDYDSYDEFYDRHDGTVDIEIYGQCANIMLRSTGYDANGIFRHGQCAVLAYALHELTGAPLVLFTSNDDEGGWHGHAGLATSDGQLLDITGFNTYDEVHSDFRNLRAEPDIVDGVEFLEIVKGGGESFDDMGEMERLIVLDFAEYVLSENVEGY